VTEILIIWTRFTFFG